MFAIAFENPETHHISYYTGKAGGDWITPNKEEAFYAYAEEGVQYIGNKLKRVAMPNHKVIAVQKEN